MTETIEAAETSETIEAAETSETIEAAETSETIEATQPSEAAVDDAAGGYDADAGTSDGPAEPLLYDFRRPPGMADNTRHFFGLGLEEAAAAIASWLSANLREPVDVSVDLIEEIRFGLFRSELVRPCNAFLFAIEGSSEQAVMQVEAELAFTILERALGSQVEEIHVPERALTWIERVVLREVLEEAGQIINRAWKEQLPLTLAMSGFEAVPEMLPQGDQQTTLRARLRIGGEGWVSGLTIVLPGTAVSNALARRPNKGPEFDPTERAESRQRIQATLAHVRLPISVRLPRFAVALRQISSLEPGMVVKSILPANAEVEIYVADKLRFTGRVGRQGENLAVEVLKSIPLGAERPDAL